MNTRQLELLDAGDEIRETDPIEANALGFAPQFLIHASLPYKKPRPDQLQNGIWVRRNGAFALHVQGGQDGIPYGSYPRVFAIWLENEVLKHKSPAISAGRSLNSFCQTLKIVNSAQASFLKQVERFLYSRYWIDRSHINVEKGKTTGRKTTDFIRPVKNLNDFWSKETNANQYSSHEWTIVLDSDFLNELLEYYVPVDMRAVAQLQRRPGALDMYQWLAYKNFVMKGPYLKITWEGLYQQFGSQMKNVRMFPKWYTENLYYVKKVYPSLRFELDGENGLLLRKSPTPVPRLQVAVSK